MSSAASQFAEFVSPNASIGKGCIPDLFLLVAMATSTFRWGQSIQCRFLNQHLLVSTATIANLAKRSWRLSQSPPATGLARFLERDADRRTTEVLSGLVPRRSSVSMVRHHHLAADDASADTAQQTHRLRTRHLAAALPRAEKP